MTYFKSVIFFLLTHFFFVAIPPFHPSDQMDRPILDENTTLPLLLVHCDNDLDQPSRGSLFIHNRLCSVDQEEFPTLPAKLLPICVTTKWKKTGLTAVFKSLRIQEDTFAE